MKALNDAGVPCGPINNIDQTFAEPQTQHLGIAKPVQPSKARRHQGRRPADQSHQGAAACEYRPTPELGQHTDEILASLGHDAAAIAGLRSRGVI